MSSIQKSASSAFKKAGVNPKQSTVKNKSSNLKEEFSFEGSCNQETTKKFFQIFNSISCRKAGFGAPQTEQKPSIKKYFEACLDQVQENHDSEDTNVTHIVAVENVESLNDSKIYSIVNDQVQILREIQLNKRQKKLQSQNRSNSAQEALKGQVSSKQPVEKSLPPWRRKAYVKNWEDKYLSMKQSEEILEHSSRNKNQTNKLQEQYHSKDRNKNNYNQKVYPKKENHSQSVKHQNSWAHTNRIQQKQRNRPRHRQCRKQIKERFRPQGQTYDQSDELVLEHVFNETMCNAFQYLKQSFYDCYKTPKSFNFNLTQSLKKARQNLTQSKKQSMESEELEELQRILEQNSKPKYSKQKKQSQANTKKTRSSRNSKRSKQKNGDNRKMWVKEETKLEKIQQEEEIQPVSIEIQDVEEQQPMLYTEDNIMDHQSMPMQLRNMNDSSGNWSFDIFPKDTIKREDIFQDSL